MSLIYYDDPRDLTKGRKVMSEETILFENGKPIAVEIDNHSIQYPLSHSFKDVNDFVHTAQYEDLVGLCLDLSSSLDKLKNESGINKLTQERK